jgi:hypothetical protein
MVHFSWPIGVTYDQPFGPVVHTLNVVREPKQPEPA